MQSLLLRIVLVLAVVVQLGSNGWAQDKADKAAEGDAKPVSFYRQVRPVLQRELLGAP